MSEEPPWVPLSRARDVSCAGVDGFSSAYLMPRDANGCSFKRIGFGFFFPIPTWARPPSALPDLCMESKLLYFIGDFSTIEFVKPPDPARLRRVRRKERMASTSCRSGPERGRWRGEGQCAQARKAEGFSGGTSRTRVKRYDPGRGRVHRASKARIPENPGATFFDMDRSWMV